MTFYKAAPTSLDIERALIRAMESMGFEKDVGDCEIDNYDREIYSVEVTVGQVNL